MIQGVESTRISWLQLMSEVVREAVDVIAPLTERGQAKVDSGEPEEQVLAKGRGVDHPFQRRVGG